MNDLITSEYWFARLIFQRSLALIYLIAFLAAVNQFLPLLGENGLLPATKFIDQVDFGQSPSIFYIYYSDNFFLFIAWIGVILSALILSGFTGKLPNWSLAWIWALLWLFYLSIVNIGQTFYSFGWESLLLEAGFIAIFLGSSRLAVPLLIIFLLRWTLFRLEFGAGLIKLRGDECWREFTCLNYHHETQPMPNPLSWYFHNLPASFHKLEGVGNFFFQLAVPWGLFFAQPVASIAAGLIILSQLWLVLSGNFAWLNWITIILAFSGFSNVYLKKIIRRPMPPKLFWSNTNQAFVFVVFFIFMTLSILPVKNMLSDRQMMNASFNPFHLVNTYGAFGSVTKERREIIIEGTDETNITADTKWSEYEFKGKPGDVGRIPPQYAPYHLRLDWLMWFAAFGPPQNQPWFFPFIEKLLKNDPAIVGLLKHDPFPDKPPQFIRARYYLYKFTTPEERKKTGAWWKRRLLGEYLPPLALP